jgi:hypothetical protein
MDWLYVSQFLFSNFVPWPYLKALTSPANTPPFGFPKQGDIQNSPVGCV